MWHDAVIRANGFDCIVNLAKTIRIIQRRDIRESCPVERPFPRKIALVANHPNIAAAAAGHEIGAAPCKIVVLRWHRYGPVWKVTIVDPANDRVAGRVRRIVADSHSSRHPAAASRISDMVQVGRRIRRVIVDAVESFAFRGACNFSEHSDSGQGQNETAGKKRHVIKVILPGLRLGKKQIPRAGHRFCGPERDRNGRAANPGLCCRSAGFSPLQRPQFAMGHCFATARLDTI